MGTKKLGRRNSISLQKNSKQVKKKEGNTRSSLKHCSNNCCKQELPKGATIGGQNFKKKKKDIYIISSCVARQDIY